MLYTYFPSYCPTSPLYLVKIRYSKLWHNVEMHYFATNYLTTELAHSKLNMVYLAELLVVMTDGLKTVRICAQNVPRTQSDTNACRWWRISRVSPAKQRCRMLGKPECRPVKTQKNRLQTQPANVRQWLLSKKVVATVCPLHFDTEPEQSDRNKSSVR